MKDRFRVHFGFTGWEIQHSKIGILWRSIGGYEYQSKQYAESIVAGLHNGESCKDWFKPKQVIQPDSGE